MATRFTNALRKNAKGVLVVMGVVCMIVFVVGPYLLDLVVGGQRNREAKSPVAVTWTKGSVQERELDLFRFRHLRTVGFLRNVIESAILQGGKPKVNGRQITEEQLQMGNFDVGIPQDSSDESLMQTMVLAEEARRMGVAVDLPAVKDFLKQLSAPELGEADLKTIAEQTIGKQGGMTVNQILEHLAVELKAQHVRMLAMAGLYGQGAGAIIPPGEAWNYFNRLNRRLAIEAYPVEVEPLVSQIKEEPTAAELQKLFDKGKFAFPNPNIDEPGFRTPHKLAFTYVKVNYQPYLEKAKQQITDEQVKTEYEKDVAAGRHKVLELPGFTPPAEPGEKKEGAASPDAAKEGEKPAEAEKKQNEAAAPADKADKAETAPGQDRAGEKKGDEPTDKKPEEGCQVEQPAAEQAVKAATEQPAAEQPAEQTPAAEKPAADKPGEDKPGDKGADEKPAEEKAAEAKQPEPKVKPLEQVADEIRTRLAQPIAEEARKKDVAEVMSAIEKYGDRLRRFENMKAINKDAKASDPGKFDIEGLAAKFNFEVGQTELADRFEIGKTEIGQKVEQFDMQAIRMGQLRMMSFAELAYAQDEPLYRPHEVRSSENDIFYVYYRTAEQKSAEITLDDVRKDVVAFWKLQRARELAKADAQKIADKAKGAAALREVVADPARIIAPPPFSWMTTGSLGFGGGARAEFSRPAGIELAGQDFMQAVFALQPGETGIAPNNSGRIVYVVRVLSQEPDDEKLKQQFLESGFNQLIMQIAQSEAFHTSGQWWQGMEEKYQVKWQRPPRMPGMGM